MGGEGSYFLTTLTLCELIALKIACKVLEEGSCAVFYCGYSVYVCVNKAWLQCAYCSTRFVYAYTCADIITPVRISHSLLSVCAPVPSQLQDYIFNIFSFIKKILVQSDFLKK